MLSVIDTIRLPELWVPVLSLLVPLVTAAAVLPEGSSNQRKLVSGVAVIIVAVLEQLITGEGFTGEELLSVAIMAAIGWFASKYSYDLFWEEREINDTVLPHVGI